MLRLNKIFRLAGFFYHIRLACFRRPMIVASGANVRAQRKKRVAREKERKERDVSCLSPLPHSTPLFCFFSCSPLFWLTKAQIGIDSDHTMFLKEFAFGFINQYVYLWTWTGRRNSSIWANTPHVVWNGKNKTLMKKTIVDGKPTG